MDFERLENRRGYKINIVQQKIDIVQYKIIISQYKTTHLPRSLIPTPSVPIVSYLPEYECCGLDLRIRSDSSQFKNLLARLLFNVLHSENSAGARRRDLQKSSFEIQEFLVFSTQFLVLIQNSSFLLTIRGPEQTIFSEQIIWRAASASRWATAWFYYKFNIFQQEIRILERQIRGFWNAEN